MKNLYRIPKQVPQIIQSHNSKFLEFNSIAFNTHRAAQFFKYSFFNKFLRFYQRDCNPLEKECIVAFWEHVGENETFQPEFFNNLKNIYEDSSVFLIIDDLYEGLITQDIVDYLEKSIKLDDFIILTSNFKVTGNSVHNIAYHLFDSNFDNIVVKDFKFSWNDKLRYKKFICLNRQERLHRILTVDYLIERDLIKHSYVSCQNLELNYIFNQIDPLKKVTSKSISINEFYKNKKYSSLQELQTFDFSQDQKNRLSNMLPLTIDSEKDITLNPRNLPRLDEYFLDSYWCLCTERDFFRSDRYIGFTEKTVKCILYGIPFVIIGLPYTLKKLQQLGFITFSSVIDESYDLIENDADRFNKIKKVIDYLGSLNYNELHLINKKLRPILEHNYERYKQIHNSLPCGEFFNRIQQWGNMKDRN